MTEIYKMDNVYNIFTKEKMPGWEEVAEDLAKKLTDIQHDIVPILQENDYAPIHVAMAMILISEKIAHNIRNDKSNGAMRDGINKGLDQFREIVRKSQTIGEL